MSSIVKIANIAPSASIVYQFLVFFFSDSAVVHSHSQWVEKVGWTAPDFQSQGTFRYGRVGADVSVGSQR